MITMEAYSVLMSVYSGETAEFFEHAVCSMLEQTVKPAEFVIVCDGPLTPELDVVIEKYVSQYQEMFRIIRLKKNVGIGAAANIGVELCRYEWIAKMDSDDIAVNNRCQMQLERIEQEPRIAVIGGYIEEFEKDETRPFAVRTVPESNDEIWEFGKRRQAFNNQTVMLRRSVVQAVGGYSSLRRNEDFDLYARILASGYYAENIRAVLTKVRMNDCAHKRRSSMQTLKGCMISRWRAYRIGYASFADVAYCVLGQLLIVLSPARVQQYLYKKLLRTDCTAHTDMQTDMGMDSDGDVEYANGETGRIATAASDGNV